MAIALIFFSLTLGIALGFWLFSKHSKFKGYINLATAYTIYLLIFSMGLAVGANKNLVSNILNIGWQAIFIAFSAMLGSIFIAILFFRYIVTKSTTK